IGSCLVVFLLCVFFFFFFFQAEDGIRDSSVTGVQTCALPICVGVDIEGLTFLGGRERSKDRDQLVADQLVQQRQVDLVGLADEEIGRASCRERVEISVGRGTVEKQREKTRYKN